MKQFIRNKEDFVCSVCSYHVQGTGYTNHCPNCLYSLHVDTHPGDRQEQCHGIMKPIDIVTQGGSPVDVIHQCQRCHVIKTNKLDDKDSMDAIIQVMEDKVRREMMR